MKRFHVQVEPSEKPAALKALAGVAVGALAVTVLLAARLLPLLALHADNGGALEDAGAAATQPCC
ncbi:Hypothetical protein Rta_22190 [Ramlibacter tataouinensis TTB310]|uniref:Uncharacterized protein n=2 Tax=Ramlibacter tataouinensis TaxID=94132 RepID=F5XZV4_RAMTT|nr:Hypothetical protein Rta_22190 [Ramlibacter tataouinensis TTB310]